MKQQSAARTLLTFSLPLILSGVLQQLYSWVDAFIVGHIEGETALAAIGSTGAVTELFAFSITGFTLGLSILAAQKFGERDTRSVTRILSGFFVPLLAVYTALSLLGTVCTEPILALLRTPANMFPYALRYLRLIFLGFPFLTLYNLYAAMLRAIGNSRAPFYGILLSSALNVALDVLLVAVLPFGVGGAALATVISQIAMAVFIALYATAKYPMLRLSLRAPREDGALLRAGCALGFPPAIQTSITALGNAVLQNFMNGFGSPTVAAVTTAYRIDSIMLLPVINLGAAISTMVAQSKGAGETPKIKKFLFSGIGMMAVVSVVLSVLMYFFGGDLIALFGVEAEASAIGTRFFRSISGFYILFATANAFRGAIEGIGRVLYSSLVWIAALAGRIALSYLLAAPLGNMAIAFAEGLSWVAILLLYVPGLIRRRSDLGLR